MAEAEPYVDVSEHLRDELRRAWLRLEYQIRLGWRKETGLGSNDTVGPEDMGGLCANARGATQPGAASKSSDSFSAFEALKLSMSSNSLVVSQRNWSVSARCGKS